MKNFIVYLKSLWANRIKPIKALKALRALAANKEDTVQAVSYTHLTLPTKA